MIRIRINGPALRAGERGRWRGYRPIRPAAAARPPPNSWQDRERAFPRLAAPDTPSWTRTPDARASFAPRQGSVDRAPLPHHTH